MCIRDRAVTAQIQAFGSLFCAAHILPSVRVSAGGSRHTCALTPPALTERPGGRHMAGACTADGLSTRETKTMKTNSAALHTVLSWSEIYGDLKPAPRSTPDEEIMNMRTRAREDRQILKTCV